MLIYIYYKLQNQNNSCSCTKYICVIKKSKFSLFLPKLRINLYQTHYVKKKYIYFVVYIYISSSFCFFISEILFFLGVPCFVWSYILSVGSFQIWSIETPFYILLIKMFCNLLRKMSSASPMNCAIKSAVDGTLWINPIDCPADQICNMKMNYIMMLVCVS